MKINRGMVFVTVLILLAIWFARNSEPLNVPINCTTPREYNYRGC
jgi:hypothetical protein